MPYIKGEPYKFVDNLWQNVVFVCWGVVLIEYHMFAMFHIVLAHAH